MSEVAFSASSMTTFSPAFEAAFSATMKREGGYVLHTIAGDTGGQTYAGIARNPNPQWPGWAFVDRGETPPTQLVRDFYYKGYWKPLHGDELPDYIASSLFDFAVNTSAPGNPATAVKIVQSMVGTEPDGQMGPKTVQALKNFPAMSPKQQFESAFALSKLKKYAAICNADQSRVQARTFLLGWVNRILGA